MIQKVNEIYKPLFLDSARYFILIGGRGAGRSTVASQYATAKLLDPEYFRCAIMRYVLGDIRNSIYREIIDRLEETKIKQSVRINDSQMIIQYANNSINAVGFRKSSSDQKAKLKSLANYNCVIIEEADEIIEEDFIQLDDSLRTVKGETKIIMMLNPPAKNHWILKRFFTLEPSKIPDYYKMVPKKNDNVVTIITSYRDNMFNLSQQTIDRYEDYKRTNESHYYNMIRGLVPETVTGKIYNNWIEIESIPHEAKLELYGLDFGYTNDPTAIVAIYGYNGGYIVDEVAYQKGMSNSDIANVFKNLERKLVIADSQEPKSIDEIKSYGITILGAVKGQGSVNQGIQYVQDQQISYTKRSKNIKHEYDNYHWIVDKEGETINKPIDNYNHALDAIRYAIASKKKTPTRQKQTDFGGVDGYIEGLL